MSDWPRHVRIYPHYFHCHSIMGSFSATSEAWKNMDLTRFNIYGQMCQHWDFLSGCYLTKRYKQFELCFMLIRAKNIIMIWLDIITRRTSKFSKSGECIKKLRDNLASPFVPFERREGSFGGQMSRMWTFLELFCLKEKITACSAICLVNLLLEK